MSGVLKKGEPVIGRPPRCLPAKIRLSRSSGVSCETATEFCFGSPSGLSAHVYEWEQNQHKQQEGIPKSMGVWRLGHFVSSMKTRWTLKKASICTLFYIGHKIINNLVLVIMTHNDKTLRKMENLWTKLWKKTKQKKSKFCHFQGRSGFIF